MSNIFISYRREDAAGHAGRLHDRLASIFGDEHVFMDVQDIHPGADFRQTIENTIAGCEALVAVIGPRWLDILRARAERKEDLVCEEIAAALRNGVPVVAVLVGGAGMPPDERLPEVLRPLARYQAIEIHDARFADGFEQLAGFLRTLPGVVPFDLNGRWSALMRRTDEYALRQGIPAASFDFDFHVVEGAISGTVNYPTGAAVIEEGAVVGRRINFRTSHVPQFENRRAIIRFMGEIVKDEIRLRCVDDTGTAREGVARRESKAS